MNSGASAAAWPASSRGQQQRELSIEGRRCPGEELGRKLNARNFVPE